MRVLLVEDSKSLRDSVTAALQESGYAVDSVGDGEEGLWLAQSNDYDVIILDILLPGLLGTAVLERLRSNGNQTQVIFLTAKDTVEDRVRGLRSGADDYLIKPFALEELLARVQALCRRAYGQRSTTIRVGDLELDTAARRATRAEGALELTAREYALLEYLMVRAGTVVSRTEIEAHIYDERANPMSNVVDSAIYSLRKKLAGADGLAPLIHTQRGQGYVLEERRP